MTPRRLPALLSALTLALTLLATSSISADFPREWFWGEDDQRAIHKSLEGRPFDLSRMNLSEWHNGKPGDLTGEIVLIDFWATWCGPCLAAIPKLNELDAMNGVTVIGICGSANGQNRMVETAQAHSMKYATARDANQTAARDWSVRWWPTYVLLDGTGTVRAVGLNTTSVGPAVEALLAERAAPGEATPPRDQASATVPARWSIQPDWLEGNAQHRAKVDALQGRPAPAAPLVQWANTEATNLADLRGNLVVLDFWATWCGPCLASVPKNNELADKYREKGVIFLGVCHPRGGEIMAETASTHGIRFPIALDSEGKTIEAYGVNGFPDYYILGRDGSVMVADVANSKVEEVLESILQNEAASGLMSGPRPTGNAYLPGQAQGNAVPLEARTGEIRLR